MNKTFGLVLYTAKVNHAFQSYKVKFSWRSKSNS